MKQIFDFTPPNKLFEDIKADAIHVWDSLGNPLFTFLKKKKKKTLN